ncbi:hypothetical protein FBY35_0173 [Streptomyces sp. SLBN-118]|nr:hypothetical protein FBY35_0173 [Streptomyces sp. SLBN-118]
MHLLVVPGKITCSRGKMYDSITVPCEGVLSYSDDGYPASASSFFGTAEGETQRDIPRAFLRSASHEVVHGFNQIHQELEGGADNSDLLGTPTTGDPGVFPDDINLRVNNWVRHHLRHLPGPVVRPGGHTFSSWSATLVPSADLNLAPDTLDVTVTAEQSQIELGEPIALTWTVTNCADYPVLVPDPVTVESTYAHITVIDSNGQRRSIPTFIIECDALKISELGPGESRTGERDCTSRKLPESASLRLRTSGLGSSGVSMVASAPMLALPSS